MKKIFIFLFFVVISISSYAGCYLWGNVNYPDREQSGWNYVELQYNSETKMYEGIVDIFGPFYVTSSDVIDMSLASFKDLFRMFGYIAWDIHYATFFYSYPARYPMRKLSEYPEDTEWIQFNPSYGRYKAEIDLGHKPETIALIPQESGITEISENVKNYEIYNIQGYRIKQITEHGIYIINGKLTIK